MADPFKEAMGRAMEPEEESGGEGGGGEHEGGGEPMMVMHSKHGNKHHKHALMESGEMKKMGEHEEGEGGGDCPMCGGSGKAE